MTVRYPQQSKPPPRQRLSLNKRGMWSHIWMLAQAVTWTWGQNSRKMLCSSCPKGGMPWSLLGPMELTVM